MNKFVQDDYPKKSTPYPGDTHHGKGMSFPMMGKKASESGKTGTKQVSVPQPVASFTRKKKSARS